MLSFADPTDLLAQQKSKQIVTVSTPTESLAVSSANARPGGMVVGAVIGGLVGGAVTAGCLGLHGAAAALPYCIIPAIVGVVLGAWFGESVTSGRRTGAAAAALELDT